MSASLFLMISHLLSQHTGGPDTRQLIIIYQTRKKTKKKHKWRKFHIFLFLFMILIFQRWGRERERNSCLFLYRLIVGVLYTSAIIILGIVFWGTEMKEKNPTVNFFVALLKCFVIRWVSRPHTNNFFFLFSVFVWFLILADDPNWYDTILLDMIFVFLVRAGNGIFDAVTWKWKWFIFEKRRNLFVK